MQEDGRVPKVSVCVISFNQERYIRRCLQSIVEQETDFDFEVIVGDDGSTDGTRLILREIAGRYPGIVKPIYHERNVGTYENYIHTHSMAAGGYVAHCDGDDYWYQGKLKCQADFLDTHPNVAAVFSNAISGKRRRNGRNECGLYRIEKILEKVFTKNICVHSSIMERRVAVDEKESGLYDYELYWLKHGNALIYIDPEVRVHYSKNPEGISQQKNFVAALEPTLKRLKERGLNDRTLERMHFDYSLLKYFSHPFDMQRPSVGKAIRLDYSAAVLGRLIVPKKIFHALKQLKKRRWQAEAKELSAEIKLRNDYVSGPVDLAANVRKQRVRK